MPGQQEQWGRLEHSDQPDSLDATVIMAQQSGRGADYSSWHANGGPGPVLSGGERPLPSRQGTNRSVFDPIPPSDRAKSLFDPGPAPAREAAPPAGNGESALPDHSAAQLPANGASQAAAGPASTPASAPLPAAAPAPAAPPAPAEGQAPDGQAPDGQVPDGLVPVGEHRDGTANGLAAPVPAPERPAAAPERPAAAPERPAAAGTAPDVSEPPAPADQAGPRSVPASAEGQVQAGPGRAGSPDPSQAYAPSAPSSQPSTNGAARRAPGHAADAPGRPADQPALKPEPGSWGDLRQRLERLPYGHPSSPYHVDGERKPPPPRLKHLELAPPARVRSSDLPAGAGRHGLANTEVDAGAASGPNDEPEQPGHEVAQAATAADDVAAVTAPAETSAPASAWRPASVAEAGGPPGERAPLGRRGADPGPADQDEGPAVAPDTVFGWQARGSGRGIAPGREEAERSSPSPATALPAPDRTEPHAVQAAGGLTTGGPTSSGLTTGGLTASDLTTAGRTTGDPVTSDLAASDPVSKPAASGPAVSNLVTGDPAASDPAASGLETWNLAASDPAESAQAPSGFVTSDPAASDPAASDLGQSGLVTSEPTASDPRPSSAPGSPQPRFIPAAGTAQPPAGQPPDFSPTITDDSKLPASRPSSDGAEPVSRPAARPSLWPVPASMDVTGEPARSMRTFTPADSAPVPDAERGTQPLTRRPSFTPRHDELPGIPEQGAAQASSTPDGSLAAEQQAEVPPQRPEPGLTGSRRAMTETTQRRSPADAGRTAAKATPTARGPGFNPAGNPPSMATDGSWTWGPARLTPDEVGVADDAYDRFRAAEGRDLFGSYGGSGLTSKLRQVEERMEHGSLDPHTEDHALLDIDVFRARFAEMLRRYPDRSSELLATRVPGALSYAFIFAVEHYADGILLVQDALEAQGFELQARKNSWNSSKNRCVYTMWHDPLGELPFEVQFHTSASLEAQHLARSSANLINDPRIAPEEAASLRSDLASAWAALHSPPDNDEISDYRRYGSSAPRR